VGATRITTTGIAVHHECRLDEAERACELFDRRKIGKGVFIFD